MPAQPRLPRHLAFEPDAGAYDRWYDENALAYEAELAAVRDVLDGRERGLEVGVGTGRFAAPLDVAYGVEPAPSMARRARSRGVAVVRGVAEQLPFASASLDLVLLVATLVFVDDARQALAESRRVLGPDGRLVVGQLDRSSPLWPEARPHVDPRARFRSAVETVEVLADAGFELAAARQTIFDPLDEIEHVPPVREGAGEGLFAVLQAEVDTP